MGARIQSVIEQVREMVIAGELAPGERLVELALSATLGVSRTPIRIALTELEREGLVERLPSRGFRVRSRSIDDIADAVDVRGTLEGMAVRLIAEREPDLALMSELDELVTAGRLLLRDAMLDPDVKVDAHAWGRINERFHEAIVHGSRNVALIAAIDQINRIPYAGPAAIALPRARSQIGTPFLVRAQHDHEELVQAIASREGTRAEHLVREHAFRSRENKRRLMLQAASRAGSRTPERSGTNVVP